MISISKQYSFDSAHQLIDDSLTDRENEIVFGKCFREHGHTYTLTVEVTGHINVSTGMILNYFDLDGIVKRYVDGELDHRDLNKVFFGMLTTAENMVRVISEVIQARIEEKYPSVRIVSITLSETPKTTAKWML